jgi:general stress protein 26
MTTSAKDAAQQAWDMMSSLDFCFLVAHGAGGMNARPMSSIVKQDEDRVYFLSNATSDQIGDIRQRPDVLLNYGDGSRRFVSTSATATISTDRALIKRLWNVGAQTFWPEGPEAADVAVIIAHPQKAEYWDGPLGVVTLAKMAASLITGSQPDMGENEKVAL